MQNDYNNRQFMRSAQSPGQESQQENKAVVEPSGFGNTPAEDVIAEAVKSALAAGSSALSGAAQAQQPNNSPNQLWLGAGNADSLPPSPPMMTGQQQENLLNKFANLMSGIDDQGQVPNQLESLLSSNGQAAFNNPHNMFGPGQPVPALPVAPEQQVQ